MVSTVPPICGFKKDILMVYHCFTNIYEHCIFAYRSAGMGLQQKDLTRQSPGKKKGFNKNGIVISLDWFVGGNLQETLFTIKLIGFSC